MQGKVVAITGGAGGIGRALGLAAGRRGARVVLLDLDEGALESVRAELAGQGIDVLALPLDVTDADACGRVFDRVADERGGLDVLINNAGVTHRSRFEQTDPAVIRRVLEVNLFGSIHCTRAALPHLRASRGVVAAMSSVAGFAPLSGRTAYCASKHALHGFFDTLRAELRDDGVAVLLVCPAFVDTQLDRRAMDGRGEAAGTPRAAVGRQLGADEVAEAVLDAVCRRRRRLLLSPVARASLLSWRLLPTLYEALMRRSQRADVG